MYIMLREFAGEETKLKGEINNMKEFMAYVRENGDIGIRNHVLIVPTVVCANHTVQLLGQIFEDAIIVNHQHGCSQGGEDLKQTFRTLLGLASNPNVAAVLIVGLGCEAIKVDDLAKEVSKTGKIVSTIEVQKSGSVSKAVEQGKKELLLMFDKISKYKREMVSIERLILGTECGGSDAFSGISANPALGKASDLIVEHGGSVILSETSEIIGAEHILQRRCINTEVGKRLIFVVNRFEQRALEMGINIREGTTSPGNIKGGLTTLEEKSLGCIYKGGETEIKEVIDYACKPSKRGLIVMDTPGDDVESMSGMVAGGAQLIVFTTGMGTPTGCPIAPVIKVSSNSPVYNRMSEHIDINAGEIIDGNKNIEELGQDIFQFIFKVANGFLTKAEISKQWDFSINRIGPTF
jgi:altronate dehydratase large subunit